VFGTLYVSRRNVTAIRNFPGLDRPECRMIVSSRNKGVAEAHVTARAMWTVAYRKYFGLWTNLAKTSDYPRMNPRTSCSRLSLVYCASPKREFESLDHVRNMSQRVSSNRVKSSEPAMARRRPGRRHGNPFASIRMSIRRRSHAQESLCAAVSSLSERISTYSRCRFFSGFTLCPVGGSGHADFDCQEQGRCHLKR